MDFLGGDQVSIVKPTPEIYFRAAQLAGIQAFSWATFEDSGPSVYAANVSDTVKLQVTDLKQPCYQLRALGHTIAPDLFTEALQIDLLVNDRSAVSILIVKEIFKVSA